MKRNMFLLILFCLVLFSTQSYGQSGYSVYGYATCDGQPLNGELVTIELHLGGEESREDTPLKKHPKVSGLSLPADETGGETYTYYTYTNSSGYFSYTLYSEGETMITIRGDSEYRLTMSDTNFGTWTFSNCFVFDYDFDGIEDADEEVLIQTYAPQIRLHPDDGTKPSSVYWYMPRTHMRYTHNNCPDCEIISHGNVTNSNITAQSHQNKPFFCFHSGSYKYSSSYSPSDHQTGFFLQQNDSTHPGASNSSDWQVYAHVYPAYNGGVAIQYWFFYPYNDWISGLNHEGDWENIIVLLDSNWNVEKLSYAQHNGYTDYEGEEIHQKIQWIDGTHPVVFSAKGSHASYAGVFLTFCSSFLLDFCSSSGTWWNTWQVGGGVVNVGEKSYPLNGCNWLRYSGRWGEIGLLFGHTSGPKGPAYQSDSWNKWKQ